MKHFLKNSLACLLLLCMAVPCFAQLGTQGIEDGAVTTPKLSTTGVMAGVYGDASHYPILSVGVDGRLMLVTLQSITGTAGTRGSLWYTGSGAPGTISGVLANDEYLNVATGDVYTYSTSWTLSGNIKGASGSNGTNGTNGAAATIAVGTTTTGAAGTSASVTNSGTSSAATFNFTIPAGATGATGPAGSNATITASLPLVYSAPNLTINNATTSTAGVSQLETSSSDATATHTVTANDTRLSNSRTPTAHASTHISTGTDAIPDATASQDGLESAADKTKLNGLSSSSGGATVVTTLPAATSSNSGTFSLLRQTGVSDKLYISLENASGTYENDQIATIAPASQPNQISGLVLWLKADTGITLNGSTVSAWADQSGSGNNASQATTAQQPAYITNQLNGYAILRFTKTNQLNISSPALTNFTIFLVYKYTVTGASYNYLMNPNVVSNNLSQSNFGFDMFDGTNARSVASATDSAGAWAYRDATNALSWIEGVQPSSYGNGGGYGSGNITGFTSTTIGRNDSTYGFAGDLAEIVLYNSQLSTANRQAIEGYLKNKYALP